MIKDIDFDEADRQNVRRILTSSYLHNDLPVLAIYRTGSTVTGTHDEGSDIDYLIILQSDEHSEYGYTWTIQDFQRDTHVDFVGLTTQDLQSPATIEEREGGKVWYIVREADRERKLLYGKDVFPELLNRTELDARVEITPKPENRGRKEMSWKIR